MNKKFFSVLMLCAGIFSTAVHAAGIDKNTAKMQAMDKITGRVSVIYVPVGGAVDFGSLSIAVRSCKTRPAEETPDNFAFADIVDTTLQGEKVNIFRGWMISSSPATHAVEHPIFDVWLLQCLDHEVDKKLLLTAEQFATREAYPMIRNDNIAAKALAPATDLQSRQMEEMNEENRPQNQLMPAIEFSYDETEEVSEENETYSDNSANDEELSAPNRDSSDAEDTSVGEQKGNSDTEDASVLEPKDNNVPDVSE